MQRTPHLAAIFAVFLTAIAAPAADFTVAQSTDRLMVSIGGKPVAAYVFHDEKILRPYFANLHAPDGRKVTRNHPPIAGQDATDHDSMHPGVWLAFGDINGQDFWRNKGRIKHVRFIEPPTAANGRLRFAAECRLFATNGTPVCSLTNRFRLAQLTNAWLLVWEATFQADAGDITFGDQEEMGLGVRVATGITEKNGGVISSSSGLKTAKSTWGQLAEWCDSSGVADGQPLGLSVMTDPANFRASWWHNRDYGLMVANPFGRAAMKQGAKNAMTVQRGETLRLRFGVAVHSNTAAEASLKPSAAYQAFLEQVGR